LTRNPATLLNLSILSTSEHRSRPMSDEISRREWFRRSAQIGGAAVAVPGLLRGEAVQAQAATAAAATGAGLRVGPDIYRSIGVRPLINGRGTYTIISGSLMLPEVRAALDAASRHYVHLDELADAVGARLAALTQAEWGMVSSGCSAALTHATAACVAGGNPDLHVRIPNLQGFPKDEAIIPTHSRNVYDAAIRAVGARVIEVSTPEEFEAALGPRTALIYVLAGPAADGSPISLSAMAPLAKARGVPILVDAAAEVLTIPNVHLQNGATLVAYSGGKCIRGPQTGGLLLGRKDLVRAAWVHSAPHHGYARALKVGKEEAIAMLMAVEMWVKRDHEAEWKDWMARLDHIGKRVAAIDGVRTTIQEPEGLSNKSPVLRILWSRDRLGVSGETIARTLLDGDPRVALFPARNGEDRSETGVSVNPYMLSTGEEKIIADRLYAVLSRPPQDPVIQMAAPSGDINGRWDVRIAYAASTSAHTLHLRQSGNDVEGTHQGDFVARDIAGTIAGDTVKLRSSITEQHGDSLSFTFSGTITGDTMSGTLDMGEYLSANWNATRRTRSRS
jgi:seryl-tRNA(Sec) selenium transferase